MATTYLVEFKVTLTTCKEFEAKDEDMASRIASELLENDAYRESIIESLDDPLNGWEDIDVSVLTSYEDGVPELTKEDYAEVYGYEYPKE